MIITLKGATFTKYLDLNSWMIISDLVGVTSSNTVTKVTKGAAYTTTFTIDTGYTLTQENVSVVCNGVTKTLTWDKLTEGGKATLSFTPDATVYISIKATGASSGGGGEEPETPTNYTFTINPTPSTATVTLTASGYTQSGNSITVPSGTSVSWSVSASGYTTQSGTQSVTSTISKSVELVATGSTVQLTSSNANSAYADSANHLNNAQTLGASLVKSSVGTKGIIGWDIPQYAVVTLTVSSGGNYGMALTDTNDIVIESFSNGSVATDGDGTYTFRPIPTAGRLYVSTTKFVSASYVVLSEDEISDYGFALLMSQSEESGQYISTTQTVGQPVALASMSSTYYLISNEIPANSTVTIKVFTGGNYGMVLADLSGNVLESKPSNQADADGNITFSKQSVPTKLWASKSKYASGSYKTGG